MLFRHREMSAQIEQGLLRDFLSLAHVFDEATGEISLSFDRGNGGFPYKHGKVIIAPMRSFSGANLFYGTTFGKFRWRPPKKPEIRGVGPQNRAKTALPRLKMLWVKTAVPKTMEAGTDMSRLYLNAALNILALGIGAPGRGGAFVSPIRDLRVQYRQATPMSRQKAYNGYLPT